jgi:hypothetical protein
MASRRESYRPFAARKPPLTDAYAPVVDPALSRLVPMGTSVTSGQ